MPFIGAHVSTAGGVANGLIRGTELGVEAIQIFGSSPRQWGVSLPTEKTLAEWEKASKETTVKTVFLHAPYLANIGHPDPEMREKSIQALAGHLRIADMLHSDGLIFHIGSGKGEEREPALKRVVDGMREVLSRVPGKTRLIIENSAGEGDKIGSTLEEIADIIKRIGDVRVRVCIDTAHAFASGMISEYTKKNLDQFAKHIEATIGKEALVALHVNDSKVPTGAKVDRHENIGEGHIGIDGFRALAKEKIVGSIAWLLEVPGFDGRGPDKKNVELLRSCL